MIRFPAVEEAVGNGERDETMRVSPTVSPHVYIWGCKIRAITFHKITFEQALLLLHVLEPGRESFLCSTWSVYNKQAANKSHLQFI